MELKDLFIVLLIVSVWLIIGLALNECQDPLRETENYNGERVIDTLVIHDTITLAEPTVVSQTILRTDTVFLPTYAVPHVAKEVDGTSDGGLARCSIPADCVAVEIPIEQKEYGDTLYHAWVSGYKVSLDSIRIFNQTDIVRIRDEVRQPRWHIGPSVGCGITPHGLQPYLGVSVTYSIISF